eukprot:4461565-Amphidinium_carterae.1
MFSCTLFLVLGIVALACGVQSDAVLSVQSDRGRSPAVEERLGIRDEMAAEYMERTVVFLSKDDRHLEEEMCKPAFMKEGGPRFWMWSAGFDSTKDAGSKKNLHKTKARCDDSCPAQTELLHL